ncbi:MAG: hypothetical protein QOF33_1945, partial [Thermomicrobiales bacterium]|nr:hypothetical protein [Thermomicrobiales bacterium]
MLRRVMAIVVVAVLVTVAVRLASDRSGGGAGASLSAPQAFLASPIAGTPEGTPSLGVELPAEIELDLLASGLVERLPSGPVSIRLERIALAAGQAIAAGGGAPQVLAVESGEVTVDGAGLSGRYGEGVQIVVPADASIAVRNTGTASASVIRLIVQSSTGAASPEGTPGGTPAALPNGSPIAAPAAEVVPNVLVAGDVSRLAGRRATLVIVRATLPPGVETDSLFFEGPVGIAVEEGTLAVEGADGALLQLDAGHGLIVPAYTTSNARNPGDKPAVVLVAAVLPTGQSGAIAPTPTPTTGPDTAATARAQSEAAAATADALATQVAGLEATIAAQETALAEAAAAQATAEAQETAAGGAANEAEATAQAQATALAATIAALQTAQADDRAALATSEAALATALTASASRATT